MPQLPSGQLRQYTADEIASFDIRTRGVRGEGDHIIEEFSPGSATSRRKLSCRWESRYDVVQYLVGQEPVIWVDSGTRKISRVPPQAHPSGDFYHWFASKILEMKPYRFSGTMNVTGLPDFDRADISVQYEPFPYLVPPDNETSLESDRYVSWEGNPDCDVEISTQTLGPFPGGIMRYAVPGGVIGPPATPVPHNKPIPYGLTIAEGEERFSLMWWRLPDSIWSSGNPLRVLLTGGGSHPFIGSVNSTFDPIKRDAGTAMLVGVKPRRRPDETGLGGYVWDLKLEFLGRPRGFFNLYYFDSDGTGARNGYYSVSKNATVVDPATVADDVTIGWVRDHSTIFSTV